MILTAYILAYILCLYLTGKDKDLNPLREQYGDGLTTFACCIISITLLPLGWYTYKLIMDLYLAAKGIVLFWIIKRKVNKLAKKHGIKERI